MFFLTPVEGLAWAQWGIFLVGFFTVAQMSFWGNYLPRVYPRHLRGTGESFAANVGGRMIGTFGALATTSLVSEMPGASVPIKLAYAGALVGTAAPTSSASSRASGCPSPRTTSPIDAPLFYRVPKDGPNPIVAVT